MKILSWSLNSEKAKCIIHFAFAKLVAIMDCIGHPFKDGSLFWS